MAIGIGTSGWSYDHWHPELYPPGLPPGSRLSRYAAAFCTAELNSSFYRWPRPTAFRSWQDRLPDDFRLSVEAPRGLTHARKLYAPETWLQRIREGWHELGDKRAVLLVQLPPSQPRDDIRLAYFLRLVPGWIRWRWNSAITAPLRIRQLSNQSSRLRAPRPRQLTGLPDIEELRRDHPGPGGQHHRLLHLPRPRRHRILPVLRRHPPVKREPQHPACPLTRTAAKSLRPRLQHIPARARPATRMASCHHRSRLPLLAYLDHGPQLPHLPAGKHQPHSDIKRECPTGPLKDIAISSQRGK